MQIVRRPLASGRPESREQWDVLALDAYRECSIEPGRDPAFLAERLGLRCELCDEDETASIVGAILFYPLLASRRQRGQLMFELLGGFLVKRTGRLAIAEAPRIVADGLILPRPLAMRVTVAELPDAQPYAPIATVRTIYRRHRGSTPFDVVPIATKSTQTSVR